MPRGSEPYSQRKALLRLRLVYSHAATGLILLRFQAKLPRFLQMFVWNAFGWSGEIWVSLLVVSPSHIALGRPRLLPMQIGLVPWLPFCDPSSPTSPYWALFISASPSPRSDSNKWSYALIILTEWEAGWWMENIYLQFIPWLFSKKI